MRKARKVKVGDIWCWDGDKYPIFYKILSVKVSNISGAAFNNLSDLKCSRNRINIHDYLTIAYRQNSNWKQIVFDSLEEIEHEQFYSILQAIIADETKSC